MQEIRTCFIRENIMGINFIYDFLSYRVNVILLYINNLLKQNIKFLFFYYLQITLPADWKKRKNDLAYRIEILAITKNYQRQNMFFCSRTKIKANLFYNSVFVVLLILQMHLYKQPEQYFYLSIYILIQLKLF